MQISLTPGARAFLEANGTDAITVASLVFSSCCSGPLPPEVKPGSPADADGFAVLPAERWTLYYDSLLDPRDRIVIDVKDFGRYQELFVQGWD